MAVADWGHAGPCGGVGLLVGLKYYKIDTTVVRQVVVDVDVASVEEVADVDT